MISFDILALDLTEIELPIFEKNAKNEDKMSNFLFEISCGSLQYRCSHENYNLKQQKVWDLSSLLSPYHYKVQIADIRLKHKKVARIDNTKTEKVPEKRNNNAKITQTTLEFSKKKEDERLQKEIEFINKEAVAIKTLEEQRSDFNNQNFGLINSVNELEGCVESKDNLIGMSNFDFLGKQLEIPNLIDSQFITPLSSQLPSPLSKQVRFSSQFLNFEYSQINHETQIHLLPFKIFTNSSSKEALSMMQRLNAPKDFYLVSLETDSRFMHCMDLIITWQTGIKLCSIDVLYNEKLTGSVLESLSENINRFDTILLIFYGDRTKELKGLSRLITFISFSKQLGCILHTEIAESFEKMQGMIETFAEQYIKLINSREH